MKMKTVDISDDWEAGIRKMEQESGGSFDIHVFTPNDMPSLVHSARAGAPNAKSLVASLNGVLEDITNRKPDNLLTCAICDRPIVMPARVGLVVPEGDTFSVAMSFGVCSHCDDRIGGDRPLLMAELQGCLREIWPDARAIIPTHDDGGRA